MTNGIQATVTTVYESIALTKSRPSQLQARGDPLGCARSRRTLYQVIGIERDGRETRHTLATLPISSAQYQQQMTHPTAALNLSLVSSEKAIVTMCS